MSFKKSNSIGKTGEKYVQNLFIKHGLNCIPSDVKEYDLLLHYQLKQFKIEVKYDVMAYHTGNLAIEYHNHRKDKPSGIFASQADYWVYVINEEFFKTAYLIKLEELVNFFTHNIGREVKGGDKNSTMRLYPLEQILSVFTRIDTIETKELLEIFK